MNDKVTKEVEELIEQYNLNCSIGEFKNKVDWMYISYHYKLSESFIKEFRDRIHWKYISIFQELSEKFIGEFKYKLNLKFLLRKRVITQDFYDHLKYHKVKRYEILDI